MEKNEVQGLKGYTAKELPEFLARKIDKELMRDFVISLGGVMPFEEDDKL